MPSTLSGILSGYTSLLDALTGFTGWTANREAHDPDDVVHRKFRLQIGAGGGRGPIQSGGTKYHFDATLLDLEVRWDPEGAESTIEGTIADDILQIVQVMEAASNKPAAVRDVVLQSWARDDAERPITIRFTFRADYQETGTFT